MSVKYPETQMYQARYDDIMNDGSDNARDRERSLFDQSIMMLEAARNEGGYSYKGIEAIHFTSRLWMIIIEDLGSTANGLPAELRASLISIGIFILKTLEAIRMETSTDYDSIIDITKTIRDGI